MSSRAICSLHLSPTLGSLQVTPMTTPDITRTADVFVSGLGRAPALTKLTRAALAWALKLARKAVVVLTLGMVKRQVHMDRQIPGMEACLWEGIKKSTQIEKRAGHATPATSAVGSTAMGQEARLSSSTAAVAATYTACGIIRYRKKCPRNPPQ